MISIDDKYRNRGKIDGPGHVIEIDHVEITNTRISADLRNDYGYLFTYIGCSKFLNMAEGKWSTM